MTAEEVAKRMRPLGFTWTASRISELESGTKSVSLAELIGLAHALGTREASVSLPDLFQGGDPVWITDSVDIETSHLLDILRGLPVSRGVNAYPHLREKALGAMSDVAEQMPKVTGDFARYGADDNMQLVSRVVDGAGTADDKAAKALGISRAALLGAAAALWGRSVTEERELRARTLESKQAKGHVTRQLLEELRTYMEKFDGDD